MGISPYPREQSQNPIPTPSQHPQNPTIPTLRCSRSWECSQTVRFQQLLGNAARGEGLGFGIRAPWTHPGNPRNPLNPRNLLNPTNPGFWKIPTCEIPAVPRECCPWRGAGIRAQGSPRGCSRNVGSWSGHSQASPLGNPGKNGIGIENSQPKSQI